MYQNGYPNRTQYETVKKNWNQLLHTLKLKSKCIKKCTRDYLGPHEVLRPLPLSGYVETHPDRGRGTGPLPLSGCVSTYPDRGRGTGPGPGPLPEKI